MIGDPRFFQSSRKARETSRRRSRPVKPTDDGSMERQDTREFSGRDARQGEIILRSRWQRVVFIAGLVGIVLLTLLATCAG